MMSPLSFIVMLMIMIIIPTILYSFFFLITCPPNNPFRIFRRRPTTAASAGDSCPEGSKTAGKNAGEDSNGNMELVVAAEVGKETECPVCLSVFTEGEDLKKLTICKHIFHKSCIDKWLSSHCNCPVCRAFVAGGQSKSKERENHRLLPRDRDDLWQGLPDSGDLI